jgi:hypothetical protein
LRCKSGLVIVGRVDQEPGRLGKIGKEPVFSAILL